MVRFPGTRKCYPSLTASERIPIAAHVRRRNTRPRARNGVERV